MKKFTKTVMKGSCENGLYMNLVFVRFLCRFLTTSFWAVWCTEATAGCARGLCTTWWSSTWHGWWHTRGLSAWHLHWHTRGLSALHWEANNHLMNREILGFWFFSWDWNVCTCTGWKTLRHRGGLGALWRHSTSCLRLSSHTTD